jgi:23S rRNA pseudouridine955/2504/2580 synthase
LKNKLTTFKINTSMELKTGKNDLGRRLDRVLRRKLEDHSLALIYRLLRQKHILVNGKPQNAQYRISEGDSIVIPTLHSERNKKKSLTNPGQPEILLLTKDLIVVNKPAGMEIHGTDSLDTMVNYYLTDKVEPSLSFKPGPLHRLDKPTSGAVVFSVSIEGAKLFSRLLRERKVGKTYLAILEGEINNEVLWRDELIRDKKEKKTYISSLSKAETGDFETAGQKTAITKITPVISSGSFTLAEAGINTGRTHQIRAQAAYHGHPLAGDRKYGSVGKGGFFLHAQKIEFLEYSITAPLPPAFSEKIYTLFGRGIS